MFDTPGSHTKGSIFESNQALSSCYVPNPVLQREISWNGRIVQKEMTTQYRKIMERQAEKIHMVQLEPLLQRSRQSSSMPATIRMSRDSKLLLTGAKELQSQYSSRFQDNPPSAFLTPREIERQALEIRRSVLRQLQSNDSPKVSQTIHMSVPDIKNKLLQLFNTLKEEWNIANVPHHHKEIYAEILRHIPKEEAIGMISKEILKIRNNQSLIQECMQSVQDREATLDQLIEAASEFDDANSDQFGQFPSVSVEKISQLFVSIRQLTLYAVESICKWKDYFAKFLCDKVDERKQTFQIVYYHQGENYLLKILCDLSDFSMQQISKYFRFSQNIDPFLLSLTLEDSTTRQHNQFIVHYVPRTIKNRMALLEDRLSRELDFAEENERCQMLPLFNPSASQMNYYDSNKSSGSVFKIRNLKNRRFLTRVSTNESGFVPSSVTTKRSIKQTDRKDPYDYLFHSSSPKKLAPYYQSSGNFYNHGNNNNNIKSSGQEKSQIQQTATTQHKHIKPQDQQRISKQKKSSNDNHRAALIEEEKQLITIIPMEIEEDLAALQISEYLRIFRESCIDESNNMFVKSFPFDSTEIMTSLKIEQESNLFWVKCQGTQGLLATHIDRLDFATRKLVISHLSVIGFDLPSHQELFLELLDKVKIYLFSNDPCAEISIALVTYEKDAYMFGVAESMEQAIKVAGFAQVDFQEDYETQLYYVKRPENQPKKQQLQQIEPVFFELQSCVVATHEGEQDNTSESWLLNGTVNAAIMSDLQKNKNNYIKPNEGDLDNNNENEDNKKQEEHEKSQETKETHFELIHKDFELLSDIRHAKFENSEKLGDYLRNNNFIFDYLPIISNGQQQSSKELHYANTEQYIRWNASHQIQVNSISHLRVNYLQGYSNIYEWFSKNSKTPVYLAETHLTNTFFFIYQLYGGESQEFFDELCKEFVASDLSPVKLAPIEESKSLVFPQFSMKLKRETNLSNGLKLCEQLLFANDFEWPIHSIKFRSYDPKLDVLITHPFIFGMVNTDIAKELNSVLFATKCD